MDKDDISNSQYIKPQVFVKISLKISCNWPQIFLLYKNDWYLGEGGGDFKSYLPLRLLISCSNTDKHDLNQNSFAD